MSLSGRIIGSVKDVERRKNDRRRQTADREKQNNRAKTMSRTSKPQIYRTAEKEKPAAYSFNPSLSASRYALCSFMHLF